MPNGTYGGVRGKGAKAKTLAPQPTRSSQTRTQSRIAYGIINTC